MTLAFIRRHPRKPGILGPVQSDQFGRNQRCCMRRSNSGRSLDLAAFRFLLAFAVILFFSSNTVAQHSGGGGSSGGSSSGSGGGGGSHGGGSSSSGSSGGGHSSGGSSSHGSSGGSGGHSSSSGSPSSHVGPSHSSGAHPVREPNSGMRSKTVPEKRGFFSMLRHPFRKPQPEPEPKLMVDLRLPICFRGPCKVCPTGLARGGGCGGAVVARYAHNACDTGRNGSACLQNHFPYDCNAERVALDRQQRRMNAALAAQKSACSTGSGQDCSDRTSAAQNETSVYRTLQAQYRACQERSIGVNPFSHTVSGHFHGLSSYPLDFDLEFDTDYR
jgi:hypothetical protein